MATASFDKGSFVYLPKTELVKLIEVLQSEGFTVLGPKLLDNVIMLRPIQSANELARGITDKQDGGYYRSLPSDDTSFIFQYAVGPQSPKSYFFPSEQKLFTMQLKDQEFLIDKEIPPAPKLAMLGIRSCEIAAILIQDRIFTQGQAPAGTFRCEMDDYHKQVFEKALIIAVNCTCPGGTCFCASMGTGPRAKEGFDLALTEQREGFVVEVGTDRGANILQQLPVREAMSVEMELAELRMDQAVKNMGRTLNTDELPKILDRNIEHPRWDEVAKRCLGCGNCTLVCPTCFCSTIVDSSDLSGTKSSRTRYWDVCYTHQFSYTTAGPVRSTIRARYRHWLRHKLGTWWAQFGMSGCVGCGRCITWCPVGIDITEEATAIRETEPAVH